MCTRSVGSVARFLEASGFSTVVLTPTPEHHHRVGMPRVVGIDYPYGRPIGEVGDIEGQRGVLLDTIRFMEQAKRPGEVLLLPYVWHEAVANTNWRPSETSPIMKLFALEMEKAGPGAEFNDIADKILRRLR